MISPALLTTLITFSALTLILLLIALLAVVDDNHRQRTAIAIGFDGLILAGLFGTASLPLLAVASTAIAFAGFILAIAYADDSAGCTHGGHCE